MVKKSADAAGMLMLFWLAFYLFAAFLAPEWSDFLLMIGCALPMFAIRKPIRGETFGSRDCNTVKYKKKDYALWFIVCICGSALLSAAFYLAARALGGTGDGTAALSIARSDFFYRLVFACMVPAFFEEYLVRGGVLGAIADRGANGVWLCALLFALMHIQPQKAVYAFFAGVMITALVYLTECIYLGMLLHFCNNFCSLLLSALPGERAEFIALGILLLLFAGSLFLLRKKKLFADAVALLRSADKDGFLALLSWPTVLFILLCVCLGILSLG